MMRTGALLAALISIGLAAPPDDRIELGNGVTLDVVKVPAGSYQMGSPAGEAGRGPDEDQHRVTIADEFWLGRTPVTRGQFARFVKDTGYKTEAETGTSGGFGFDGTALVQRKEFNWRNPGFPQTDAHPVVIVTYDDALAFTRWLARKSGRKVTLPTEAQWEYACRAGTTTRFHGGDADADVEGIAWFKKNAGNTTHPVAEKAPNEFGLYDMSGNVYEWCSDLYAAYVPGGGEQGPMDKPRRVLRGGSWLKDAKQVRSAARARNAPGSRNADNGFRIVMGPVVPVQAAAPVTPKVVPEPVPPPPAIPEADPLPVERDPTLPRSRESSSGCGLGVFILVLVVGVVVVAVVLFAFRKRGNVQPPPPPRPMFRAAPRIVDDGFWFDTSGYSAGDLVSYTYTGPNGTVTEQFMVDPGAREQFIYTGLRPRDILLANLIANQMQQPPYIPPPTSRPSSWTQHSDDRPRRNPPAY